MRTPRAKPRPIAGSPQRRGRYPRPFPAPVEAPPARPVAHAAAAPANAPKPPPRASKRPSSTPPAEPAQTEGATLPTVSADGPLIKVVEGLRGVVTRWERSGLGTLALVAFQRLDGTPARAHPVTVERHRGCAVEWVRGRAAR